MMQRRSLPRKQSNEVDTLRVKPFSLQLTKYHEFMISPRESWKTVYS